MENKPLFVKHYIFGIQSDSIKKFSPFIESDWSYRESYIMFFAIDENGVLYKCIVKKNKEKQCMKLINKYRDASIKIDNMQNEIVSDTETVLTNRFHRKYNCTINNANNFSVDMTCGIELQQHNPNSQVPTMGEWSIIFTCLLILVVFYKKSCSYCKI